MIVFSSLRLGLLLSIILVITADEEGSACGDNTCNSNQDCATVSSSGDDICICKPGWAGPDCQIEVTVGDEEETRAPSSAPVYFTPCGGEACNPREQCAEMDNGDSICICKSGWEGVNCQDDIDECKEDPPACDFPGSYCVNRFPFDGYYACACDTSEGLWLPGSDFDAHGPTSCDNINECEEGTHNCHVNATCTDLSPGFSCSCRLGHVGDGVTSCATANVDILPKIEHRCSVDETGASEECPSENSYCDTTLNLHLCRCKTGYFAPSGLGGTCQPIDECTDGTNPCDKRNDNSGGTRATCSNEDPPELWSCACNDGWEPAPGTEEGINCINLNECAIGLHNCDNETEVCIDLVPPGLFECVPITEEPSASPTSSPTSSCFDTTLTINLDFFPAETFWNLYELEAVNTFPVVLSGAPAGTYTSAETSVVISLGCLETRTKCYIFEMLDTFGDGNFNPDPWSIRYGNTVISSPTDGSYFYNEEVRFGACEGALVSCRNPLLSIQLDNWPAETSWLLALRPDSEPRQILGYNTAPYQSSFALVREPLVCLDLDSSCYEFSIFDSFGDGLSGNNYQISDPFQIQLAEFFLFGDYQTHLLGDCGTQTPTIPPQPVPVGCNGSPNEFEFCVLISPDSLMIRDLVGEASARWGDVITGDIAPTQLTASDISNLEAFCDIPLGLVAPSVIDDLKVCAFQTLLSSSILGLSITYDGIGTNGFPAFGLFVINSLFIESDLTEIERRTLLDTVTHELGHVLGIGSLWAEKGLIPSEFAFSCNNYSGENLIREYQELSGCNSPPPIEDNWGNSGTDCSHLDEFCFGAELMSTAASGNEPEPLSRLSVAMLEDLGYEVDYSMADPYSADALASSCRCNRRLGESGAENDTGEEKTNESRRFLSERTRGDALEVAQQEIDRVKSIFGDSSGTITVNVLAYEGGVVHDVTLQG